MADLAKTATFTGPNTIFRHFKFLKNRHIIPAINIPPSKKLNNEYRELQGDKMKECIVLLGNLS